MVVYEVYRRNADQCGGVAAAIRAGLFVPWDDERIKQAFNNGNGTRADFNKYQQANRALCVYFIMEG